MASKADITRIFQVLTVQVMVRVMVPLLQCMVLHKIIKGTNTASGSALREILML
jgi:hypothetical protein